MKNERVIESKFSEDDFWNGNHLDLEDNRALKKRLSKWVIVCFISIIVLVLIVIENAGNEDDLILEVVPVSSGHVVETYRANGTIESERMQVFHSPVSAPISELNVQIGDSVRAGDLIIAYDLESLELHYQQSALQLDATRYGNQATIQMSEQDQNQQANDLHQQNIREANLRSEITELEDEIERLRGVEEAQSESIRVYIADIQAKRLDNRGAYSRLFAERSNLILELQEFSTTLADRGEILNQITGIDDLMVELDDEMRELDRDLEAAQLASLSVSTDERMLAQQELANVRFMLANLETAPAFPMTNPQLTSGQMQSMQVSEELLELSMLSAQELFERAEAGIRAEFDGIISSLLVREGSTAIQGGVLFTLVSNQDIVVQLEIPANNFERVIVGNEAVIQLGSREYRGVVERVNRVAVPNALGQMVIEAIVSIENPDDYVFVGVPARVDLTVAERLDALYLPPEVVNMASSGHFVHVVSDGVVERRFVEVGIASNHQIEITYGVEYGELVVAEVLAIDLEGVQAVPRLRE